MEMDVVARIKAGMDFERGRDAAPDGFPALPLIDGRRYTDPEFLALESRLLWKRSWLARGWGMASTDLPENETVPFLVHWSRGPRPAASYRDLGTLLGRYGVDRTELLDTIAHGVGANNGNGTVGTQGGQLQC